MASVFHRGSRAISRLNDTIREQLDNLVHHKCTILIGDANGADRAVQRYFAERCYNQVVVFCMDECRNNLGQWQAKSLKDATGKKRDFEYYATQRPRHGPGRELRNGAMGWEKRGDPK